ncbi:hypothetical protein MPTK1_4g20580 [Marchantia polymorpha subsp. ruderalis]|nr:hypothetical protein MARPO_0101s0004 [Marchantia polymorpha]PTQ32199.1 hypothetical protein MARPO_0101s0004 [Marchantia polymorpha]BBN09541.1 hypothetical protein Mp_4g20580 [Marchantia polymorpha subsp. ruderalis]BBN09542.1 hypothetical protein Mp_4g20580 [Marchantia polymorpha subsp. ruderalis]|eukprot:PTQ32198.1 hypothetical protein MARPO_0101s0004 [Marchantia polymorpha]
MASGSSKHHEAGRIQSASNGGRDNGGTGFSLQQLLLSAVALVLIPSILFAFHNLNATQTALQSPSAMMSKRSVAPATIATAAAKLQFAVQLSPTYENVDGTEYVWQIPSFSDPSKKVRGIVFFAHGCYGRSTFFWDTHPNCENCTGMPEERLLTLNSLSRGYAVIAVSSTAECWKASVDVPKVVTVLKSWTARYRLEHLPVVALGASSGGYFVSILAAQYKFQSLVIQISYLGKVDGMVIDSTYPPTLFVYMPKDTRLALRIKDSRNLLRSKGVETDEVLCTELKVTPHFFSNKIPAINDDVSEKLVAVFKDYGLLNHAGYMKLDGRSSGWIGPVRKRNVLPFAMRRKLERHLEEELNLAYAFHEMTSVPAEAILDWFDAHSHTSSLIESS